MMKIFSVVFLTSNLLPVASQDGLEILSYAATCTNWNKPCPANFARIQCKQDPCSSSNCSKGTKCLPNYCGSCIAVCCGGNEIGNEIEDKEDLSEMKYQENENMVCVKKDIRRRDDGSFVLRDPLNNCEFPSCEKEPVRFACRKDSRKCPDGTAVFRDRNNGCMFFLCPSTDEEETVVVGETEALTVDEGAKDTIEEIEAAEIIGANEIFPDEKETDVIGESAIQEDQVRGCFKDFRQCEDGSIVIRDPLNNCEFNSCSETVGANEIFSDEDETDLVAESAIKEVQVRACTKDLRGCEDGITMVTRDPLNNCEFERCPGDDSRRTCDSEEHVCGDLSTVSRNTEKCCVFYPCPVETMMERIERRIQEMACEAASFTLLPRPRSGE